MVWVRRSTMLLTAMAMSACSSAATAPQTSICDTPAGASYALAYPQNGATGVSASTSEILVYTWGPPASGPQLQLIAAGAQVFTEALLPAPPSPLPHAIATPPAQVNNATLLAAGVQPLSPRTSYSVSLKNASLGCGGAPLSVSLGRFSTG